MAHHAALRRPTPAALMRELARAAEPNRVGSLAWFKTGKGGYAEHDRFIGVSMPKMRVIARKYRLLKLADVEVLLSSLIHEHRFTALIILVDYYERSDIRVRQKVFSFYIRHIRQVNSWDLVDMSAPSIVGAHLVSRSRRVLYRLAQSRVLWERRIAMVATSAFIEKGDLKDTFAIARCLLADEEDLIHKAVGWMLREAGDVSRTELIEFLKCNYSQLPRATLRYAIEHFPQEKRKRALRGLL
jgi:3-methyladenine DNA glycosylase AlkD